MGFLPDLVDAAEFDRRRNHHELWRPAIEAIAARHHLSGTPTAFATGSAVVFAVGDHVVKLHEPWNRTHCEVEAACLERLAGALDLPSPRLAATGELEDWTYLVMTRLPGQPLSEVHDRLAPADRIAICEEVGRLAADLHSVPVAGPFAGMVAWPDFIAGQRAGCLARHRGYGVPARLLATLESQLESVDVTTASPVLLHTELSDTNLMVRHDHGRWRLSGVFDFEPAMVGHPHYDLPAITIFVAHGDPQSSRVALAAAGIARPDDRLRRELLALILLHRYSRLDFFLEQVGITDYPTDWDELAFRLLGF